LEELPRATVDDLVSDLEDVEGWLTPAEIELLYRLAASVAPIGTIVEIGSWKGRSTIVLARALAKRGAGVVHAVDPHTGSEEHGLDIDTFDAFLGNIERKGAADQVTPHRAASLDVAAGWTEPLGMVWIDGSHEYEEVAADIKAWGRHLVPGGVMAVHDTTTWAGPGKAVDRFVVRDRLFAGHGLVHYTLFARRLESPRSPLQGLRARWVGFVRRAVSTGIRVQRFAPGWTIGMMRSGSRILRRATHPRFLRR
jgi:predicted O-methyltransferase YrrM